MWVQWPRRVLEFLQCYRTYNELSAFVLDRFTYQLIHELIKNESAQLAVRIGAWSDNYIKLVSYSNLII